MNSSTQYNKFKKNNNKHNNCKHRNRAHPMHREDASLQNTDHSLTVVSMTNLI